MRIEARRLAATRVPGIFDSILGVWVSVLVYVCVLISLAD
jgi:hypothetical protein